MSEIVAEAVRRNLAKSYADGYTDGVKETLLQILGESTIAPDGCYRGPLPPEIKSWVRTVLGRIKGTA